MMISAAIGVAVNNGVKTGADLPSSIKELLSNLFANVKNILSKPSSIQLGTNSLGYVEMADDLNFTAYEDTLQLLKNAAGDSYVAAKAEITSELERLKSAGEFPKPVIQEENISTLVVANSDPDYHFANVISLIVTMIQSSSTEEALKEAQHVCEHISNALDSAAYMQMVVSTEAAVDLILEATPEAITKSKMPQLSAADANKILGTLEESIRIHEAKQDVQELQKQHEGADAPATAGKSRRRR